MVDEMRCEYCGRSRSVNQAATCDGCGALLSAVGVYGDGTGVIAYVYDPRVFDSEVPTLFGQPGENIPLKLHAGYRVSSALMRHGDGTGKYGT